MYGRSDIYNPSADQFGLFNKLPEIFSDPLRGTAAILTGGVSELGRRKRGRLQDAEKRAERIVAKLNKLHENDKMVNARRRARKLANVIEKMEDLADDVGRPAKISRDARAWAAYAEDRDLAKLERRLGRILWTGEEEEEDFFEDEFDDEFDDGLSGAEPGMYIAAPEAGLVPSHSSGIRGGIQVGPATYAPAYTAMPPSMSMGPGYGPPGPTNIFINRPRPRPRPRPAPRPSAPGRPTGFWRNKLKGGRGRPTGFWRNKLKGGRGGRGLRPAKRPIGRHPSRPVPTRKPIGILGGRPGKMPTMTNKRRGLMTAMRGRKRFGEDPRMIDSRTDDFRTLDTRDGFGGMIGANAFSIPGVGSGLTRQDLLDDSDIEDLIDFDAEFDDMDGGSRFGLFKRDIEKDLESVRRKLERMNEKGLRNNRQRKRYARLKEKHDHLLEVMQESRARLVPRYTDPTARAMFQDDVEDIEELEDLVEDLDEDDDEDDALDMEIVDLDIDPREESILMAIDTLEENDGPIEEIERLERELVRLRAGV